MDVYAEAGDVPVGALLDLGWWFECSGCGRSIGQDLVDNPDEAWDYSADQALPAMSPVGTYRSQCFCTPACRDDYLEEKLLRESAQEIAIQRLSEWVTERYPGTTLGKFRHARADKHGRIESVTVAMEFPEARYGGAVFDGLPPNVSLRVTCGDYDAWLRYREHAWAYPDLPRLTERSVR